MNQFKTGYTVPVHSIWYRILRSRRLLHSLQLIHDLHTYTSIFIIA